VLTFGERTTFDADVIIALKSKPINFPNEHPFKER
jgi:hypothetical protein